MATADRSETVPVDVISHDDPYADIVFADPAPKSVNVTIGGERYVLKEATEDAHVAWECARSGGARLEDGVLTGMGETPKADVTLLSKCLFKIGGKDGKTQVQVGEQTIKSWATRVVQPLVVRLKLISGISENETADVLRKRIAADGKKLAKLEAVAAGEEEPSGPKGSPSGSPGTSGSAPSEDAPSGNSLTGRTSG